MCLCVCLCDECDDNSDCSYGDNVCVNDRCNDCNADAECNADDYCNAGDCEPKCGNNIREGSEECDGGDDNACPGQCDASCECPSDFQCNDGEDQIDTEEPEDDIADYPDDPGCFNYVDHSEIDDEEDTWCGDGKCDVAFEDETNCPLDCGGDACACHNGIYEPACGEQCDDGDKGICSPDEICINCECFDKPGGGGNF